MGMVERGRGKGEIGERGDGTGEEIILRQSSESDDHISQGRNEVYIRDLQQCQSTKEVKGATMNLYLKNKEESFFLCFCATKTLEM